jgi:hypothetical protein
MKIFATYLMDDGLMYTTYKKLLYIKDKQTNRENARKT